MERWRPVAILLVVAFLVSCFSGCLGAEKTKIMEENPPAINIENNSTFYKSHVVVAVCDLGINPYHEVFRRPNNTQPPWTYIPGFPKDIIALNLTFDGTYEENVESDNETWAKVEKGKLYWIPGTCIIGAISFSFPSGIVDLNSHQYYILEEDPHGSGATSCVLEANQNASIVVVQSGYRLAVDSLSWAVNQSWIDIITHEYGNNNLPGMPSVPEWWSIPKISQFGWAMGKILIASAGNRPVPVMGQPQTAPPSFISIGGSNEDAKGEILIASKTPDFVSNWLHKTPASRKIKEYENIGGTSWSGPYAAGIFSNILLKLRQQLNYSNGIYDVAIIKISEKNITITNQDIRSAANKTAIYWNIADYDVTKNQILPNGSDPNGIVASLEAGPLSTSIPVLPLPFLQMGWGYIGPEMVNATVDLLLGRKQYEPSLEKQLAEPYMSAIYELRKQFWDNWPLEC